MSTFKLVQAHLQPSTDPTMNQYQPMPYIIPPDSSNALHDFDMCLAMSQKAINSQLEYAWDAWKYNQSLQDSRDIITFDEHGNLVVDLFKVKDSKTGQLKASGLGFKAILTPLSIDLNVPNALRRTVKVTFRLQEGSGAYYDEATEGVETYGFSDCCVSFHTDLGRRLVDRTTLAQIDPKAAEAAKAIIEASPLDDSVFSIEYLFLELGKVNMILNSDVSADTDLADAALKNIQTKFALLLDRSLSQFMLGTVVRRNTEQPTPTFALTDFLFDVSAHSADPEASSLNYLGMFSGRGMPKDKALDNALIKMSDNWLRPEMVNGQKDSVAGMMAIRRDLFLGEFLIPKFEKALNIKALPTGNGNHNFFFFEDKKEKTMHHYVTSFSSYSLTLSVMSGLDKLMLKGRINSSVHYQAKPFGESRASTSELKASGYRTISGHVTLIPNSIGTDFDVRFELDHTIGEFILEEEEIKGLGHLLELNSDILVGLKIQDKSLMDMIKNGSSGMATAMANRLNKALKELDMNLSQQAFIPPGGGVFTFQNLRFSNQTGDLLLDVLYQS